MSTPTGHATHQRRLSPATKIAVHVLALALLATVTIMVVEEGPVILEEKDGEALPASDVTHTAQRTEDAALGGHEVDLQRSEEDDLFDLLTTPDDSGDKLVETGSKNATIQGVQLRPGEPLPAGAVCEKYGEASCKNVSATCVKRGPVCSYDKVCVVRSKKCTPGGICTRSMKKCDYVFPKQCVACAKKTSACQSAHRTATSCVGDCQKSCMKNAECEDKCAKGCLSKYAGFIKSCKKQCKDCQQGTKQVCWDACQDWKICAKQVQTCASEDTCEKSGQKCTFKKVCEEEEQHCSMVDECSHQVDECNDAPCIKRDTKCTHPPQPACLKCAATTTSCKREKVVKATCNSDCELACKQGDASKKAACSQKCNSECNADRAALRQLCHKECPACKQKSNACHLKCLEFGKQTCTKVCKYTKVKKCRPVCKKYKMQKSCTAMCAKWAKKRVCHHTCNKWHFSKDRPCEHDCLRHGWKHSCDESQTHCVQWTGGKVCDKKPCLAYKKAPPLPLAPGPVIPKPAHAGVPEGQKMPPVDKLDTATASANATSPPNITAPGSNVQDQKLRSMMAKAADDIDDMLGGAGRTAAAQAPVAPPAAGTEALKADEAQKASEAVKAVEAVKADAAKVRASEAKQAPQPAAASKPADGPAAMNKVLQQPAKNATASATEADSVKQAKTEAKHEAAAEGIGTAKNSSELSSWSTEVVMPTSFAEVPLHGDVSALQTNPDLTVLPEETFTAAPDGLGIDLERLGMDHLGSQGLSSDTPTQHQQWVVPFHEAETKASLEEYPEASQAVAQLLQARTRDFVVKAPDGNVRARAMANKKAKFDAVQASLAAAERSMNGY